MHKLVATLVATAAVFAADRCSAQWQALAPDSSLMSLFASDSEIFYGTFQGRMYVSGDTGQTWTELTHNLPNQPITSIGMCGSGRLVCSTGTRVYTTDDRLTWHQSFDIGYGILGMFVADTAIYVAGEIGGGLSASFNSGDSWTNITNFPGDQYMTSVAAIGPNIMAGRFYGTTVRSTDFGATWSSTNMSDIKGLDAPNNFIAGADTRILKWNGTSWTTSLLTSSYVRDFAFDQSYIAAALGVVYLTEQPGSTWVTIPGPVLGAGAYWVAFFDGYLLGGGQNGLFLLDVANYLAVPENKQSLGIHVSPNPASDELTIQTLDARCGDTRVRLFNSVGEVVRTWGYACTSSQVALDVSSLGNGAYVIVVEQDDQTSRGKVVIAR